MSFEKLNLSPSILKALKAEGYTQPTPIQEQSIPVILERKDLLGCAQTGTGKTAAFALPILHLLDSDRTKQAARKEIRALILTPTRELAIQISESFEAYGKHTSLKHLVIFGGVSAFNQINSLRSGTDILVATPGRLLDLMAQKAINLQHIQLFVLDEADRMLDMGFINDVKKVIAKLPAKRQTLLFSATMPSEIAGLANSILRNPSKVEVTPVSSTAEKISQSVYPVDKKDKASLLLHLLDNKEMENILVFTRTKFGADKLAKLLNRANVSADAIHGNKSQNARQKALTNFKSGAIRVLVATDIAARGIDVEELKYVINFELPNQPETYVHRIGRTGRAGNSGTAISFCDLEEQEYLRDINKITSQTIPVVDNHPYFVVGRAMTHAPAKPAANKGKNAKRRPFRPKKKAFASN
ncbi:DEAD/DEAH box helicase [Pedobacter sp. SYSU D00535]|uniref:DEAD/DEAH box helicase n=1 Tax=Pedobacter sp. SYSU D00535 TaxID=2810308 RepID=UPI001A970B1D|nr:DEAD/DEAH box helicase [Pedobacter sp. SYSU D00535]